MAAATKTSRTLQASASNAAGGTTTATAWNLTTALGGTVQGRITNGGTGPTIACTMTINVSTDNSTWRTFFQATAGTTASTAYDFVVDLPMPVMYCQVVFTGNTAQSVTVEAFGHELSTIA